MKIYSAVVTCVWNIGNTDRKFRLHALLCSVADALSNWGK